jgi:hypothetical protein
METPILILPSAAGAAASPVPPLAAGAAEDPPQPISVPAARVVVNNKLSNFFFMLPPLLNKHGVQLVLFVHIS